MTLTSHVAKDALDRAETARHHAESELAIAFAHQVQAECDAGGRDGHAVAGALDEIRLSLPSWGGATREEIYHRLTHAIDRLRDGDPPNAATSDLSRWAGQTVSGVPF